MASADSTYLVLLSHLLPSKNTTVLLRSSPLFFMVLSQRPRFWKDCLLPTSKTSRTICECSKKGFLISSQSGLPLMSKKLTATFLLPTLTFLTPQSTPMVVMYLLTNLPSQYLFMMQDLPVLASPIEISCVNWQVPSAVSGCPTFCPIICITVQTTPSYNKQEAIQLTMQAKKVPALSQPASRTLRDIVNNNKVPLSKYIHKKVAASDKNMTYFSKLRRIIRNNQVYMETCVQTESNATTIQESERNKSCTKIPVPLNQKVTNYQPTKLLGEDGLSHRRISELPSNEIRKQLAKKRAVTNISYAACLKKYKAETVNYGKFTRVPSTSDPEQDKLVCQKWGKVQLLDSLGTGANAVVREATCNEQTYAVKIYEKYKLLEPRKRKRVYTQIELLRGIPEHPNIIQMHEAFEDKRQIHVIFQHLRDSITLHQHFRNNLLQLQEKEVQKIFGRVVRGVCHLHENGIAHRDIKPDNILLTWDEDGKPILKIIDFGFATSNSKADLHCGTPNFMAPELLDKTVKYHPMSVDIWALGVTLFYLLEARYPFKGYDEKDLFRQIRAGKYEHRRVESQDIRQLISRMLQVNPSERATAEELLLSQWVLLS